jgi:hypothetical protein
MGAPTCDRRATDILALFRASAPIRTHSLRAGAIAASPARAPSLRRSRYVMVWYTGT